MDSTFEPEMYETLPTTTKEFHYLEELYLGKSIIHIGKFLHIMQYNCPELMYAVNSLSSYSAYLYVPVYQGVKNLIH